MASQNFLSKITSSISNMFQQSTVHADSAKSSDNPFLNSDAKVAPVNIQPPAAVINNPALLPPQQVSEPTLPYPGKFNEFNKENKAVCQMNPEVWEGGKIEVGKIVQQDESAGKQFRLNNTFYLGYSELQGASSYEFDAQLVQGNSMVQGQYFAAHGGITGTAVVQPMPSVTSLLQFQYMPAPNPSMAVLQTSVANAESDVTVKLQNDGTIATSFFKSVTPNIAAGAQLEHQYKAGKTNLSAAIRATREFDIFTLGTNVIQGVNVAEFGYTRKLGERLMMGANMMVTETRESAFKFGILKQGKVSAVGLGYDNNHHLSVNYSEMVVASDVLQLRYTIVADAGLATDEYKFGLGFKLDF